MANYDTFIVLDLTDANGNRASMRVSLGSVADTVTLAVFAANITAALTALGAPGTITNAKVTSAVGSFVYEKASPSGALDAQYSGVEDGARISMVNSLGGKISSTIPAPVPAVFGAAPNEDTVDSAGPAAAWIAYLAGHAVSNGSVTNVYNGGVKVGRHARRRAQHRVA